ncbi:MAG: OmpH family outer membrane protein [Polaribacter sp.]|nr:OmpH family outer membrane protein [Polaribacter sp.]
MKKIAFIVVLLCTVQLSSAQKKQTLAYIDMEYILENVPEYITAQNTLQEKVEKWKSNLKKLERHIEVLKTDLATEKAILTKDLIDEREENITLKQEELTRLEALYFGPKGDLFLLRKQLVKPVQDQVYNAIQNIAKRKKYDFVFDKSSELVMLYSNKKYDISELVLSRIVKGRKIKEISKKSSTKKQEAKAKATALQKARLDKKAAKTKELQRRRAAKLKEQEKKRKLLREKKDALKKEKEGN